MYDVSRYVLIAEFAQKTIYFGENRRKTDHATESCALNSVDVENWHKGCRSKITNPRYLMATK